MQANRLHAFASLASTKRLSDGRITIHDQLLLVLLVLEKAVLVVGQFVGNCLHPPFIRFGGPVRELDAASFPFHDKEQIKVVRPPLVQASTVMKSTEAMMKLCAFRNVSQDPVRLRSGTGSMPWTSRMLLIVESPILQPTFDNASLIRSQPQVGFSFAYWTVKSTTTCRVIGRAPVSNAW